MRKWFTDLINEEIEGYSVAAMRILFGLVWVHELIWAIPFYDSIYSLRVPGQSLWFCVWLATSITFLFGAFTRTSAAINWICTLVFNFTGSIQYHIEVYAQILTFYCIFIDSGRCWSFDAWLAKKRGRETSTWVWHFPILVFMFHAATIYLDAGLCHWFLNPSWRNGYAILQSFLHPQLSTRSGFFFAQFKTFAMMANYSTIVFEISFLFILLPFLFDRRHQLVSSLLGLCAVCIHLGITLTLDIGGFGPAPIAFVLPFFSPSLIQGLVVGRRSDWKYFRFRERRLVEHKTRTLNTKFFLVIAPILVFLSSIIQIPVLATLTASSPRLMQDWFLARRVFGVLVGDDRPHNVFSIWSTEVAFSIVSIGIHENGEQETLPLLFDQIGKRVGFGNHARIYFYWLCNLGRDFPPLFTDDRKQFMSWTVRFKKSINPLLVALFDRTDYPDLARIDFYYRFESVPNGMASNRRNFRPYGPVRFARVEVIRTESKPEFRFTFDEPVPKFSGF